MNWTYRLKRHLWSHESHKQWAECDEQGRKKIEAQSPNRFDFKPAVKAVIPPAAVVNKKEKDENQKHKIKINV